MMIEKGIRFDDIHSYFDLNLILSKCEIPPATPKTTFVDLAGGDGSLDMTEAHGEVKFNDRDGCKFTFTMNPSDDLSDESFEQKKTEVSNALNGKYFEKITLGKDAAYYYTGRCAVDDYLSDKRLRQIIVTARVKPYKLKQDKTIVTHELTAEEQTVIIKNGRKSVVPEITCTDNNVSLKFGEFETTLSAGTHTILDVHFKEGENTLILSGSGAITFTYQEGEL